MGPESIGARRWSLKVVRLMDGQLYESVSKDSIEVQGNDPIPDSNSIDTSWYLCS